MCQGLVENEESFTPWMHLIKNSNHLIDLNKQLHVVPPWITTDPQINNHLGILDDIPLFIADDQMPVFFLDKIGDVDDAAMSLLLEDLFSLLSPFHTCQTGVLMDNHSGAYHILCLYSFA